jgi:hypothetical protein
MFLPTNRVLCLHPAESTANLGCSGQVGVTAEEAVRALPGADELTDHDAGTGDLLHRNGQHQQGDAGRHEERRNSHEADTRRPHNRQGRQRHVRLKPPPSST